MVFKGLSAHPRPHTNVQIIAGIIFNTRKRERGRGCFLGRGKEVSEVKEFKEYTTH
jgi:hypothetical protein